MEKITEEDRDRLCDILWWLKGYKKGSKENLETSDFVQDHLDSLDKVVRHLREVLSPPTKEDPKVKDFEKSFGKWGVVPDSVIKAFSEEMHKLNDLDVDKALEELEAVNKIVRDGITIMVIGDGKQAQVYSNLHGKYFNVNVDINPDVPIENRTVRHDSENHRID